MGYIMCAFFIANGGWQLVFWTQVALMMPVLFSVLFVPLKYIDLENAATMKNSKITKLRRNSSIEEDPRVSLGQFNAQPSELHGHFKADSETTIQRVGSVLRNPVFVSMALSLSGLYFLTTGIQYWGSDYLQIALQVEATEVYYIFSFTCLTAPISGVMLGGYFFTKLGGYNSPKSFTWCCIIGGVGVLVAAPIAVAPNKYVAYLFLWLLLFVGSAILPTMTGIMLNAVAERRRTTANGVATLGYNLFGYLPAPFIYGWVS